MPRSASETAGVGLVVDVPGLGGTAALVPAQPTPTLAVAAGRYFLTVSSPTAGVPTETLILHGLATRVLQRLGVTLTGTAASGTLGRKQWGSDWAGPAFCPSNYGQPVLRHREGGKAVPTTFHGVAACGEAFTLTSSNTQGPIWWRSGDSARGKRLVEFDSTGYQCVEYADRYFYYLTGKPGPWTDGSNIATRIYDEYRKADPRLGLVPKPKTPKTKVGGTTQYSPSLHAGDIISMWRSGDTVGHVAVVTKVAVHRDAHGHYDGYVDMINENAGATGITHLTVRTGTLSYDSGYFTTFQWLTGLPTS